MLNRIELKNFKCFSKLNLELSNLNVFAGLNGMGKSSVIQSILLYVQSKEQYNNLERIILNGNYVSLGTGKDVLFEDTSETSIGIRLFENDVLTDLELVYDPDSDVMELSVPISNTCNSLDRYFEYICAARLSPQTVYEKSSVHVNNDRLGIYGQYTAHYLSIHQEDKIDDNGISRTLGQSVQAWLNEISPNVKFNTSPISNADLAQISYYYTGLKDALKTNEYRPTNVGFGISYVLPIITALLKAKAGSVLILENPEAHLHPHGQRIIGELIALCASRGVQVFLETHSDHIINGIRVSVKNGVVASESIKLFYFSNGDDPFSRNVDSPRILNNGRLDYWPDGFFDEWEKALDEII